MDAAERASMEMLLPLMKDAGRLKDWVSSNCESADVSGDELSMYWDAMDMGSSGMPAVMSVCKQSDDSQTQIATYEPLASPLFTYWESCNLPNMHFAYAMERRARASGLLATMANKCRRDVWTHGAR